jgi:hypothetical protein
VIESKDVHFVSWFTKILLIIKNFVYTHHNEFDEVIGYLRKFDIAIHDEGDIWHFVCGSHKIIYDYTHCHVIVELLLWRCNFNVPILQPLYLAIILDIFCN